jgi:anti-anti-sigma factor
MSVSMETSLKDGILIVCVSGRVDAANADEFGAKLAELTDAPDTKRVILECSKLAYVSSAGLRVLLKTVKSLRQHNGSLSLCAANPNVQELLRIAGFTSFLNVYVSVEEAVKGS